MDRDQTACLSLLREGDRDRYLCALLMPEDRRGAIAALFAFNLEIARIRDLVTEPMAGEIRLQWWRDLIAGEREEEASGHPVAAALMRAVDACALPRQTLVNLVEARRFDLYDDPMPDRNTFEGYAGETASALVQLAALILDAEKAASTSVAAGHAGVAHLTAGVLQLAPRHQARGQVYVPSEILTVAGLDRDSFLEGGSPQAVSTVIQAFCALGREHLERARDAIGAVAPSCFAAFLPVTVAEMVFDRAERSAATVLEKPLEIPQWRRQIRFWNAARRLRL